MRRPDHLPTNDLDQMRDSLDLSSMPLAQLPSGKSVYAEKHDRTTTSSTPDIPITFIHGMNCTHHSYDRVLPLLPEYTRIVYDVEPFGQTRPTGGPLDTCSQARDVHDVLAYYGYTTAHVVAHSGGCTIGAQVAHDCPAMVRTLVLVAPLTLPFPLDWPMDWIIQPTETLVSLWQSWGSKRALADPAYLAAVKAEVEASEDRKEDAYRHFDGLKNYRLDNISGVKAVVIEGPEDSTPGVNPKVVALTLNGQYIEMSGCGHCPMVEETEAFAKVLKQVLSG
jgi:pimeloyl-ACP methyl ester carboxylesterase